MEMAKFEREATSGRNYGREIAMREITTCNNCTQHLDLRRTETTVLKYIANSKWNPCSQKNTVSSEFDCETITNKMKDSSELEMTAWENVNLISIRSIALTLGPNLLSVNFSFCQLLTEEMLEVLCSRLFVLQKMNLTSCPLLGDISCHILAKFCGETLNHLNMSKCFLLTNNAFKWLSGAKHNSRKCKVLKFLDVSHNRNIDGNGLRYLQKGLRSLSCLNLSSCEKISTQAITALIKKCSYLTTLNITDCHQISEEKIIIALEKVTHVRKATSFFGYTPMDEEHDPRVHAQKRILEYQSAVLIQNLMRNYQLRREASQILQNLRFNKSALDIQYCYQRYCRRKHHLKLQRIKLEKNKAVVLQRYIRSRKIKLQLRTMEKLTPSVIKIQTVFRGVCARENDTLVRPAIVKLHLQRLANIRHKNAILIQSYSRRFLAISEANIKRLMLNTSLSCAVLIQNSFRVYQAKQTLATLKYVKQLREKSKLKSALLIQACYSSYQFKKERQRVLSALKFRNKLETSKAITIQSLIRAYNGRKRASTIRENRKQAATNIQRIFRGSEVIPWKYLKRNIINDHILQRKEREIKESKLNSSKRFANKDFSDNNDLYCINTEKLNMKIDNQENEILDDSHLFERSIIGLKCKIYCILREKYILGKFEKFNTRTNKFMIVYDDLDREWINIKKDHDRILLFADGSWKKLNMYVPPFLKKIWMNKERQKELRKEQCERKDIALSWVSLGWDDKLNRNIYYSSILKKKMSATTKENFDDWKISVNDAHASDSTVSLWYFKHRKDSRIIPWDANDPRLEELESQTMYNPLREKLLMDLRYSSYIGKGVLENFKANKIKSKGLLYSKKLNKEKERLSKSLKQLSSLINQAKLLWNFDIKESFPEQEELRNYTELLKDIAKQLND